MFAMPQQENPLASLLQGFGGTFIPQYLEGQKKRQDQNSVNRALDRLNDPNASPLDFIREMSSASPEAQRTLLAAWQIDQKSKKQKEDRSILNNILGFGSSNTQESFGQPPTPSQNVVPSLIDPPQLGKSPNELTDQQIQAVSLINPEFGRILEAQKKAAIKKTQEEQKLNRKIFESDRDFESQRALPILKEADARLPNIEARKAALPRMKKAILEGESGFFTGDNFANLTGIESLRSQEGAELITSTKEFLLSSIGRAGSRPNQWIEQQISLMLPQVGRKKEANLATAEILDAEVQLDDARLKTTYRLAEEDRQKYGYVRGDIAQRIEKEIAPEADKIQKDLSVKLRKIYEDTKTDEELQRLKTVTQGTPLTERMAKIIFERVNNDPVKAAKMAKQMGFADIEE
jgi:hypothetical protein